MWYILIFDANYAFRNFQQLFMQLFIILNKLPCTSLFGALPIYLFGIAEITQMCNFEIINVLNKKNVLQAITCEQQFHVLVMSIFYLS
jgi:hypothetical protein